MAVESLARRVYSSKSDVWAFGVLLWEIMTLCFLPYNEINDDKEVAQAVMAGERLPKPDQCPDQVYAIMRSCWQPKPKDRPVMTDIHSQLQGELVQESNNNALLAAVTAERTRWQSDGLGSTKLFAVPATSSEFVDIESQFLQTLPRSRINRIERIENAPMHESFLLQVMALKQQLADDWDAASMRRLLFHGTSAVEDIINSVDGHGFLPLLAGTSTGAIWGDGTYFARDAKYSDDYARIHGGAKQMMLVDVLLRRSAQGAKGHEIPANMQPQG